MKRRVVITGVGCISPLGVDVPTVWQKIIDGQSGAGPITLFDAKNFPVRIAAEVKDWDIGRLDTEFAAWRKHARQTQFAIAAGVQAARSAGLDESNTDPLLTGLYLGCGEIFQDFGHFADAMGESIDGSQLDLSKLIEREQNICALEAANLYEPGIACSYLAGRLNAQGPNANFTAACVSASKAIGESIEVIRRGDADVMFTGGAHSMIHPFGITGFHRLSTLSARNDSPQQASRPFERDRDGFVTGEGGTILALEELQHAKARGAKIWGELTGFGTAHDAFRITDPHPTGRAAAAAMQNALADAQLDCSEISYINAHGSGTKVNDSMETMAVKQAFGARASRVPISSTKSMTGHLTTACGAIEMLFSTLALQNNILPPTINYENPDPQCDLDYVPNQAREVVCQHAMSNSFGFGGQNVSLIVFKYTG